jgi:flagellar hook-associated protein 2
VSDIYAPGITSRFNTDKLIEGLMKIERVPKERSEKDREILQAQRGYWQDINRRISTLRDSARQLYSFQNPFSDRVVTSSDGTVLAGTATRQTAPWSREFIIKQIAQADRFLSEPLDESFKVPAGTYTFSSGKEKVSFDFKGGSLRDFVDALMRRGKGKIEASLVTVKTGTKTLLIESKITGADNKLVFSDASIDLAIKTGLLENIQETAKNVIISTDSVTDKSLELPEKKLVSFENGSLIVNAGGSASIAIPGDISASKGLTIVFETATVVRATEAVVVPEPPTGPSVPVSGSASYNGIVIDNDPSSVPLPKWKPPVPPVRVDDMDVVSLTLSDGTSFIFSPLEDVNAFKSHQYQILDTGDGKNLVSLDIVNNNTHRDVLIQHIIIIDPNDPGALKPKNPVSVAQDAIISMEGIDVVRSTNTIDDLLPGVTVTVKKPSGTPVQIMVEADKATIKDTIISFVGNYNRLMAEINVVTRNDDRIIQELSYLSADEQAEFRKQLGTFSGDSALTSFKNSLQNAVAFPYPAADGTALLAQFGISTDVRMSGGISGYDPSRLRGYLEIDEKKLDDALENNLAAIQQVFGYDTNGDLIVDSGLAYTFESLCKPYVETGGLISIKIATLDSRIKADDSRIAALDKQLAAKEAALKSQYSQMENAFSRMEQMTNSLDNFSQQNSGNR